MNSVQSETRDTVVRVKFGSHLYGTNTPDSDLDFKSVHLPSADDILLQRVPKSIKNSRQKQANEKNTADDVDEESYSLDYYLKLLAEGQTGAIDMLFAPASHLLERTEIWDAIWINRNRLLTRKVAACVGYCRTQANKYGIKGSRVAAAKAASEFFQSELAKRGTTAKVGDASYQMYSLTGDHTHIVELPISSGSELGWFFECCDRKVNFTAPLKMAAEIYTKLYENYGHRARLAESNEGVDWKALSHAVRVGSQTLELLTTEHITFPLPNAAHVLEIKTGQLPYQQVAEEIEGLLVAVDDATNTSSLRENPDRSFIETFVKDQYLSKIYSSN